jgi:hypothetical protein
MLPVIKEHLGHLTQSVSRIQALAEELEESLGISAPEFTPHPPPDQSDVSARPLSLQSLSLWDWGMQ